MKYIAQNEIQSYKSMKLHSSYIIKMIITFVCLFQFRNMLFVTKMDSTKQKRIQGCFQNSDTHTHMMEENMIQSDFRISEWKPPTFNTNNDKCVGGACQISIYKCVCVCVYNL